MIAVGISMLPLDLFLVDQPEQHLGGGLAHAVVRHAHCGQFRIDDGGKIDVVKPGDRHVLRHPQAEFARLLHCAHRKHVIAAKNRRRTWRKRHQVPEGPCALVKRVGRLDHRQLIRLDTGAFRSGPHAFHPVGGAVVHLGDAGNHGEPAMSLGQDYLGQPGRGGAIVEADEIAVFATKVPGTEKRNAAAAEELDARLRPRRADQQQAVNAAAAMTSICSRSRAGE
jgi:hypothetical protein